MPTVRDIEAVSEGAQAFVKFARPHGDMHHGHGHGTRASQCDGKKPFEAFSLADKAASRRKKRQVYKCRFCRSWHVGTRG